MNSGFRSFVEKQKTRWESSACSISNDVSKSKFDCCEQLRDATKGVTTSKAVPAAKSQFSFDNSAANFLPSPQFSFGNLTKVESISITSSNFSAATISANAQLKSGAVIGGHNICKNCGYKTKHSGHFNLHLKEGCELAKPMKDQNCPICCKAFTHNQLRYHIRQYLIDSSKAQNGHQHFSPADHAKILNKLKQEKYGRKERKTNKL